VLELIIVLVASTPFTVLVAMLPPVVNVLLEITVEVADTPFTVVVKTFPERDVVSELMIVATRDDIPFTIVVKVFVLVDTVFVVLAAVTVILVVATTPLIVEVNKDVTVAKDKVLVVLLVVASEANKVVVDTRS
jgi:hypothetical protein